MTPIHLFGSAARARAPWLLGLGLALLVGAGSAPVTAAPNAYVDRMHARALESFRQGRFPEAYGRFIESANAGHPASARYALWMCEQGLALFGKDWDCAPHEAEDWSRMAGLALLKSGDRHLIGPASSRSNTGR